MADDRKPLPQDTAKESQDFQVVQVLHQSRELAASRLASDDTDQDSGWRELDGRLERIIDRLGVDGSEPSRAPVAGMDRIDRNSFTIEQDTTDHAVASLMALADRPDEDQLELANRAVRDLEDSLP